MANNPFSITFGIEPSNLIKRIKETDKVIAEFSSETVSNYVYVITGLRGSGKTVLLSTIAERFAKDKDWVVVDPGPKDNLLENVAAELYETAKVKKLFVKGELSFSFHGITFSLKGKEPVATANTLLKKMLDHLKAKGKRVLITIDEIDKSEQMKAFVQAYQSFLRLKYPVFLLMTGLYDNVSKLQDDKSITFLYRAPKIYLEPLSINSIALSYQKHLGANPEEALSLAKMTGGYAYAYQVLGYLLFDAGLKRPDEDVLADYDQYLAEYVYDKLYSELSGMEQTILHHLKNDEPTKMDALSSLSGIEPKALSVYRDRLLKKGVILSPKYGYLQLSLPRFERYLTTK
ncbi:MAG: AAA family ATPase [Bacilli bacterium]|nr:AAA family ATPase [Bacilli bacterium]